MEAVGLLQEPHDARQALGSLGPRDEPALDAYQQGHDPEARAARGDDVGVVVGVVAVDMEAFARGPGVGFGTIPKVAEGAVLDFADEGAIAQALRGRARFADPRVSAEFDAGRAECRLQSCAYGGAGREYEDPESGRSEQDRSEQDASEHGGSELWSDGVGSVGFSGSRGW